MSIIISGKLKGITGTVKFIPEKEQWKFFDPYTVGKTYSAVHESTLDLSSQGFGTIDVTFSPDGTNMLVLDHLNDSVRLFNLGMPWNITTATYTNVSRYLGTEDFDPKSIYVTEDGTKMYVFNYRFVYYYTMSTPWNPSTASYTNKRYQPFNSSYIRDIVLSPDGTKLYAVDNLNDKIWQHSMSTPWDVQTASLETSIPVYISNPAGFAISPDGTRLFLISYAANNSRVRSYTLATPWNISTMNYDNILFNVSVVADAWNLVFAPDGSRMFVADINNKQIHSFLPLEQ